MKYNNRRPCDYYTTNSLPFPVAVTVSAGVVKIDVGVFTPLCYNIIEQLYRIRRMRIADGVG